MDTIEKRMREHAAVPPPVAYTPYIEAMTQTVRDALEKHGTVSPFVVIGSLTENFSMPVGGLEQLPSSIAGLLITKLAGEFNAEFVMIGRTTIGAQARTYDEAQAMAKRYERPEDVPNARVVVYITLETYAGAWAGIKEVETIDGKTTVGEVCMGQIDQTTPLLNLLPRRSSDRLQ
ncbi:hypothetical protein [Burkholderia sp. LMG 21824]|uniref:hypothetical protein n=1 Tax=Burkholderia sp. LMG 21824 TaxID=3158172 RepID=UPI003C2ACDDE